MLLELKPILEIQTHSQFGVGWWFFFAFFLSLNKYLFSFSGCNSSCFSKHRTAVCRKLSGSGSAFSCRSRNYWWRGCSLLLPDALHCMAFLSLLFCVSAEERALSRVAVLLDSPWECWKRCHWPNTQIHLSGGSFWEVWGTTSSPCHGLSSQIRPSGAASHSPHHCALFVCFCRATCRSVIMASRNRFLFSPLPLIIYFNNSWKFSCKLEFTEVIWATG